MKKTTCQDPPNKPSDQYLTPQEKNKERQKDEITTPQEFKISNLTNFIPPNEKRKNTKRRINDLSRPPNEPKLSPANSLDSRPLDRPL